MKLILPIPPSANRLVRYDKVRGRVDTQRYMTWKNAAGWELQAQARGIGFNSPVSIAIGLSEKSRLDLDNCIKPTIDLLVKHRVIPDDRKAFVRSVTVNWQSEDDKLHVTVEPIEQQEAA